MPISETQKNALAQSAATITEHASAITQQIAALVVDAPPAPPPPPPPPPPPSPTWKKAADERGSFIIPPNTRVRYGADTRWAERTLSGTVVCSNATFGDPANGVVKTCQVLNDVVVSPVPVTPAPPPPAPPPPAPPPPAPPPPSAGARQLYFAAGGNNANTGITGTPGSSDGPKRDVTGINLSALDPGTDLMFERGAVFVLSRIPVMNPNATPAARIRCRPYGDVSRPRPILQFAQDAGFYFGRNFGDMTSHGGYGLEGLHIRGPGSGNGFGIFTQGNLHDLDIDDCQIEGWGIGINSQGGENTRRLRVRGGAIHNNAAMGFLGTVHESLFEGVDFSGNVQSDSHFDHNVYMSGGTNNIVRRLRMVSDRPARGGTLTVHGLVNGLTIEDCEIAYGPGSDEGAWAISVHTYAREADEGFRNLIIRNNRIRNDANSGIVAQNCPGVIIEGNRIELTRARAMTAISHWDNREDTGDFTGPGIVRNNRAFGPAGSQMSFGYVAGDQETGTNTVTIGVSSMPPP